MSSFENRNLVLGDFDEEMQRRREVGERARRKDFIAVPLALALLLFAVWPLGLDVLHLIALFGGLIWLHFISEGPASQVADELDLLERKVVARFADLEKTAS